jgi:hypothetical protein
MEARALSSLVVTFYFYNSHIFIGTV